MASEGLTVQSRRTEGNKCLSTVSRSLMFASYGSIDIDGLDLSRVAHGLAPRVWRLDPSLFLSDIGTISGVSGLDGPLLEPLS